MKLMQFNWKNQLFTMEYRKEFELKTRQAKVEEGQRERQDLLPNAEQDHD